MKMLGLIGGMSWESTALYYKIINHEVKRAKGGLHSARLLLYSFNFEDIAALQSAGRWHDAAAKMVEAGKALKAAGAEALVICTNTMHKLAGEIEEKVELPLIHIADCTGMEIQEQAIKKVGLLGTRFTMEQPFYRERLEQKFHVNVVVPDEQDRAIVHDVIFRELCQGIVNPQSRVQYEAIIARLKEQGAEAVILGCTEISLLMPGKESGGTALFDTTAIHARHAAHYAMSP